MKMFFCEKPSQAQTVAEVLSASYTKKDGYLLGDEGNVYTYAFGHITSLVTPETINENFSWKGDLSQFPFMVKHIPIHLNNDSGCKKQYGVIKSLFEQCSEIVVATDAGREGEHIFRTVYDLAKCKKPFARMWMQDMTPTGVNKAYNERKSGTEYDSLALAARLRAEADWIIGMNGTIYAARYLNTKLSLGRVQTPTLWMIVNRELEITNFTSKTYYSLTSPTNIEKVNFDLKREESVELTQNEANLLIQELQHIAPTDFSIEEKQSKEAPQKLFDLTELQKTCNKEFGFTASDTLAIAQSLYEKKLTTYPRTSSQYLASDEGLKEKLEALGATEILNNNWSIQSSFVNPAKVTDHDALIVTGLAPKGDLSENEMKVYELVKQRFLSAFYPSATKLTVSATFKKGQELFNAQQTVVTELGWMKLYGKQTETAQLASFTANDIQPLQTKEIVTQPKKRYNDSTLLNDMKNAAKFISDDPELSKMLKNTDAQGIGTPATRASIIEGLLLRELIQRKGKLLVPTDKGIELVKKFGDDFILFSPKLTAIWETNLELITANETTEEAFYALIADNLNNMIRQINQATKFESTLPERESIAKCPKCQKDIFENPKGYSCSGYKEGCKVTVWKNGLEKMGKKSITKKEAKALLEGKTPTVKLLSKAGKPYEAPVKYNPENNYLNVIFDK